MTNDMDSDGITNSNMDLSINTAQFGMDNCATHHIRGNKSLFTDIRELPKSIHVNGISGSKEAAGIGNIKFILLDNDGRKHVVTLKNVIYLPECAKNLISISQWSEERGDNAGILTRGVFSYFM